jgi:cysteinyl-tRNA synthetase
MLLDPATAEAEIKAKTEADQAKLAAKEKARVEKEAQEEVKRKKAMVPPGEMFRVQTEKYSAWDERGLPTHDAAGQDLSKTAKKNVQKEYEKQEKLHAKYLESQSPPAS